MTVFKPIASLYRRTGKRWFSIFFSLLGVVGLTFYITRYSSELYRLSELSVGSVVLLSLVIVLGHLLYSMKFRLSASIFGINLSYREAFMMVESGSLISIVPFSAMGFRALYLKKMYGLRYIDFGVGTLIILVTGFTSAGVLGLIGLLNLFLEGEARASYLLPALFLAYVLGSFVVLGIALWFRRSGHGNPRPLREGQKLNWWSKIYRSMLDGSDVILTQPQAVAQFFLVSLLTSLVLATRYWLVSEFLGYSFDFWSCVVLQSTSQLSAIVTVLPAGTIGLREAFVGLGATGLNDQAVTGVMISTVDRIVATTWIVLLGTISVFVLRNKIAQAEQAISTSEVRDLPT